MVSWNVILYLVAAMSVVLAAGPLGMIKKNIPKLNAQIEKLEPCRDTADTPIQFKDIVISQTGFNKYVLKGKINITETLDKPINMVMEMFRCKSKEDPTSCEYYFTMKKGGICDLLKQNDKTWEFFTNGTDLPPNCPFPPKEYTIDGSTIDLHRMNFVPFFKSHWRINNRLYKGKKLMFCVLSEFSLQMI